MGLVPFDLPVSILIEVFLNSRRCIVSRTYPNLFVRAGTRHDLGNAAARLRLRRAPGAVAVAPRIRQSQLPPLGSRPTRARIIFGARNLFVCALES